MPRSLLRYEQVRRRGDTPDVQENDAPFTEGRYFEASCLSSASVNDCVKVTGTSAGRPRVRLCDPNDPTMMPMVGVIVEKASPQVCLVQVSGLITSLSGLVAGETYFVGSAGQPITPDPPVLLHQIVGIALRTAQLLLYPSQLAWKQLPGALDVFGEVPGGPINGMNTTFTTAQPFLAGTLRVYFNGVRLHSGVANDYVIPTSSSMTLAIAPRVGDTLLVDYRA